MWTATGWAIVVLGCDMVNNCRTRASVAVRALPHFQCFNWCPCWSRLHHYRKPMRIFLWAGRICRLMITLIHCHGTNWEHSGVRPLTIRRTALDDASKSARIRFFQSAFSAQLASKPKLDKNEKQFVYTRRCQTRRSDSQSYSSLANGRSPSLREDLGEENNNPIQRLIILSWNFPLWRSSVQWWYRIWVIEIKRKKSITSVNLQLGYFKEKLDKKMRFFGRTFNNCVSHIVVRWNLLTRMLLSNALLSCR